MSLNVLIANIAAKQHGLITTRQLARIGVRSPQITSRVRNGYLHPVYRTVYGVGHPPRSREARWMAAVLAHGPETVLSHEPAGAHWGIWRRASDAIHVTTNRNPRGSTVASIIAHRRKIQPDECTVHEDVPITTPTRTILDLGELLTPWQLTNVLNEAAFRQVLDLPALRDRLHSPARFPGARCVRAALALYESGSVGTRSKLEDAFIALLLRCGLRVPLVNVRMVEGVFNAELDFRWPAQRVVVELDGRQHGRPRDIAHDKAIDEALERAGYIVLRFSWWDVHHRPKQTIARLRKALARTVCTQT